MVYRRKGRDTFTFQGRTRTGYDQIGTGVKDKNLAAKIEGMWQDLADDRAWDILEKVRPLRKKPVPGTVTVGQLHDLWVECKRNVAALRRRLNDIDIEPLVAEWHTWLKSQKGKDWAQHALTHVRRIVPEGKPLRASQVTDTWLTTELAKIGLKRNTVRKVHASWSSFFGYCADVQKAFDYNPMSRVTRPDRQKHPPAFYDEATVDRIIGWQPTDARRAFMALVYGTGADVTPALLLEKQDIDPVTHEVRIRGTKFHTRDRLVRVADRLWPIFWEGVRRVVMYRVFPRYWNRWTVADWHRQTVGPGVKDKHGNVIQAGLDLATKLPLRHARHHFAVRLLKAGAPIKLVSEQLGSDEKTVLDYYGPWITNASDRARWEKVATKQETQRRKAQ